MLNKDQLEFVINQSKGRNGKHWLEVLEAIVDDLYSTKGIPEDQWKARQLAAACIEKSLIGIMKVGSQELNPQNNNEYL